MRYCKIWSDRPQSVQDCILVLLLFWLLPYLYQFPQQAAHWLPLRVVPGQDQGRVLTRILHELLPLLVSGALIGGLLSGLSRRGLGIGLLVLVAVFFLHIGTYHCDACAVYHPGRSKLARLYHGYGHWLQVGGAAVAVWGIGVWWRRRWRRRLRAGRAALAKPGLSSWWRPDIRMALGLVLVGFCLVRRMPLAESDNPRAVPTYECVGLYWQPKDAQAGETCSVRYRTGWFGAWKDGLPLWFDKRNGEYRGSLVGLRADTRYQIELRTERERQSFAVRTRSEKPVIGRTYYLVGGTYDAALLVRHGGRPGMYALYCPTPGEDVVIDVKDQHEYGVEIAASHVIVRGLTIRNAHQDGVRINGVHDVWVEDCDISGWGRADRINPVFGRATDAGIRCKVPNGRGFVIQRNRIHHPRLGANNWLQELHPGRGNYHPSGPVGIIWGENQGRHIVRHNSVFSDDEHAFGDGIGGWNNFSRQGFPGADSDVYGNRVSHCWDDALEIEGGGCNVRVWGNVLDKTMVGIATTACTVGPLYVFRNVLADSRWCAYPDGDTDQLAGPGTSFERLNRGYFAKVGEAAEGGSGRQYWLHNTMLQRPPAPGRRLTMGAAHGLLNVGYTKMIRELVSLNNIWYIAHTPENHFPERAVLRAGTDSTTNCFDYDLYNGELQKVHPDAERYGRRAIPVFEKHTLLAWPAMLKSDSPGHDQGCLIPNFNDQYHGKAPDIGAVERDGEATR